MPKKQTFYVVDGTLMAVDKLDTHSVAAGRLRDAWRDASNPRIVWPFYMDDIEGGFLKANPDAGVYSRCASVSDDGMMAFLQDLLGDADATVYVLNTRNPLALTLSEAPSYPDPTLDVLEKRKGSDVLETTISTSLREFVSSNLGENDPDQSVLYRIKVAWDEYATVHGDKLDQVLKMIDGQSKGPTFGAHVTFDDSHRNQVLRALEDHERRTAPKAPAP